MTIDNTLSLINFSASQDDSINESILQRQVSAQQALLQLSVTCHHFDNKTDLFAEAAQVAVAISKAQAGFLYLRQSADPNSRRLGESTSYRQVQEFFNPEGSGGSAKISSVPLSLIEEASSQGIPWLCEDRRHLLVPLHREEKSLAVIELVHCQGHHFSSFDIGLMEELIVQLDSALQTQQQLTAKSELVDLAQDLSAELELSTLLDKIARAAAEIVYAEAGSILLIQPKDQAMRFAAVHGLSENEREGLRRLVVPLRGSMAGSVVLTGKPVVSNDVRQDPRFYPGVSDSVTMKTRSLMAVPVIAQDKPIGALEAINQKYDDGFDENDVEILTQFATQAAIAIQNARLLAERQASLAEMTKVEQRKSQFIALASHELRTPLNLVTGYATLLRASLEEMELPETHETLDSLDQIEQAANRLTVMVNNITSMHNLETGRTKLLLEQKEITELIEQVVDEYSEWARQKGIRIVYPTPPGPVYAICDPLEVNRILGNLMNNAVKFTPEGGQIRLWTEVQPILVNAPCTSQDQRYEVVVAISDTGPGIDPAQLKIVFERFAQLGNHLNRVQNGIGLGLPLVKALVEKHGGQLWAETNEGTGTTFYFTLPAPKKGDN